MWMRLNPIRASFTSVGLITQESLTVSNSRLPFLWSPPPGKLLPSVEGGSLRWSRWMA